MFPSGFDRWPLHRSRAQKHELQADASDQVCLEDPTRSAHGYIEEGLGEGRDDEEVGGDDLGKEDCAEGLGGFYTCFCVYLLQRKVIMYTCCVFFVLLALEDFEAQFSFGFAMQFVNIAMQIP